MPALARLALIAAATLGCASSTLRSGLPPGDSPERYTERWHAAFLFGLVEASGPYDLERICPSGWAEVTVAPDAFTAVAGIATLFVYSPSRITVVCAADGVHGTPPRIGYALPRAPQTPEVP